MAQASHYKTKRHRRWREAVLRRDKYLCVECKRYGRKTAATHAHHIEPVDKRPDLAYIVSNGASLCTKCHSKVESRFDIAKEKRKKYFCDDEKIF